MIKLSWPERVKATDKFHKDQVNANPRHRIDDTAKLLNRSHGRICEDLLLASWLVTHPKLAEIKNIEEAIAWVRGKKQEYKRRYVG